MHGETGGRAGDAIGVRAPLQRRGGTTPYLDVCWWAQPHRELGMRLLFILPEFGPTARGGIGTYYSHVLPALAAEGCQIDVCVAAERDTAAVEQSQLRVRFVTANGISAARARVSHLRAVPGVQHSLALAFAAWDACDGGRGYDAVEATDFGLLFVPWLVAGGGPPVLVQLHGSGGQVDYYDPIAGNELTGLTTRLLETALLGRADALQALGIPTASFWRDLLEREVECMPPLWQTRPACPPAATHPLQVANGGVVVGRLQRWKGPELLCEAVRLLGDRAPTIHWIGRDMPYRDLSRSMSEHLARRYPDVWGHRVIHAGEMSPDAVAAVQRTAKFVVVPSLWDTMNLAAVEALACGAVVVCSDGAGAIDLIDDGDSGLRFPAGDAKALAAQLTAANHMSDVRRREMGERARQSVAERLDTTAAVRMRVDAYRRMIARPITRRSHLWIDSMFGSGAPSEDFAFLSQLPIRPMLRHITSRVFKKARRGRR